MQDQSTSTSRNGELFFWQRVLKTDGCWLWTGVLTDRGYGQFIPSGRHGDKMAKAHRFSYELHFGPINDSKMFVCHKCDNPRCVRPDHLFLGRCLDNARDAKAKNRHSHGSKHGAAKLTEEKVREIRRLRSEGKTLESIASQFGIFFSTVHKIATFKTWKHIL